MLFKCLVEEQTSYLPTALNFCRDCKRICGLGFETSTIALVVSLFLCRYFFVFGVAFFINPLEREKLSHLENTRHDTSI